MYLLGYKVIHNLSLNLQYRLVKEALHERANLLAIAPHLSAPLPIMLPVYRQVQCRACFTLEISPREPYVSNKKYM